jgi:hypothetical protein
LQAEGVAATFPNLIACIVQIEPAQVDDQRLDSDLLEPLLARVFASELFAYGIGKVIVIPPMPPELAAQVAGAIVGGLDPAPDPLLVRPLDAWLEILENVRAQIAGFPAADPGTMHEISLDLCLYGVAEGEPQTSP